MRTIGALILVAALGACGGTDTAAPYLLGGAVAVTGDPPADVTVTYSATGVSPASVSVGAGGRIRFVNSDTVAHWPESNSHCTIPQHQQCPWINMALTGPPAGIQPGGEAFTSVATAAPATCGFHDHLHPPSCGGGY